MQKFGDFIEISHEECKTTDGSIYLQYYVYDKNTNIVYVLFDSNSRPYLAMSPYYIINEKGEPEIAVYGVNY